MPDLETNLLLFNEGLLLRNNFRGKQFAGKINYTALSGGKGKGKGGD